MSETTNYDPVSVEDANGRILTGIGVTKASLEDAIDAASSSPDEKPEPTPAEAPTTPAITDPPKRTHGQKRFAQLTAEREEEVRQRQAVERERDDLRTKLAAAELRVTPSPTPSRVEEPPKTAATPPPVTATRPKPTEDEVGTKYQTYGDYVEDLSDWKAEQRIQKLDLDAQIRTGYDRIEADRASRTLADQNASAVARGRAAYPDFDAAVTQSPVSTSINWGFFDQAQTMPRLQLIIAHPQSEHVRYGLVKNPEKALALSVETDIGKFIEGLNQFVPGAAVAPPASTGIAGMSIAPPPYQPVAAGSKTTVTPSADLARKGGFDFDKSGYRERRAAERGIRRMK